MAVFRDEVARKGNEERGVDVANQPSTESWWVERVAEIMNKTGRWQKQLGYRIAPVAMVCSMWWPCVAERHG
jgi:hypothetical protein